MPITVKFKARDSFYGPLVEKTTTFDSEYKYKVWKQNNELRGCYTGGGDDARWAARDIMVIGHTGPNKYC